MIYKHISRETIYTCTRAEWGSLLNKANCLASLTTQLETVLIHYLTNMCTEILVFLVLTFVQTTHKHTHHCILYKGYCFLIGRIDCPKFRVAARHETFTLSLGLVVRTGKSRKSLCTTILHKLFWLNIYFRVSNVKFSCQNTTNKPHIMSKRIKFIFHESSTCSFRRILAALKV